jgi:hypothetical protein
MRGFLSLTEHFWDFLHKHLLFLFGCISILTACTPSTLTPISNADMRHYQGKATLLIAVDGSDERKVRHLELSTAQEPEGYEIYFHDEKKGHGLIALQVPAPSSDLYLKEYSLTGMYGCSRGKAGYGSGSKHIAHIKPGATYFLGTINTSMNTTYNEMPEALIKEAKEKYHYTPHGEDLGAHKIF